jgi:hypothetical protein
LPASAGKATRLAASAGFDAARYLIKLADGFSRIRELAAESRVGNGSFPPPARAAQKVDAGVIF